MIAQSCDSALLLLLLLLLLLALLTISLHAFAPHTDTSHECLGL